MSDTDRMPCVILVPCRRPGSLGVPCRLCAVTNHDHGHPPYELRPETSGYAGPVWTPSGKHRDPLFPIMLLDKMETLGRGLVTWMNRRGRHAR